MSGRTLRFSTIAALPALALALAGCGSTSRTAETAPGTSTATPPASATAPAQTTALRVYFLHDGLIATGALRRVPRTQAVAAAALRELFAGPTAEERGFGLASAIPAGATFLDLTVANGVASLGLPGDYSRAALAQVVYTLTQFPTVDAVEVGGHRLARADFEGVTPAILVESPTPGERVASPLEVRGTANTFEAVFRLHVTDADGKIVADRTVTATSGSGTRGTFDVTVSFAVDRAGLGEVIAFEPNAANGAPTHVSEVPVRLQG